MDPHGASESQPPTPKTTYHSPTSHLSSLPPTPQTTFHSPTSHMSSLPPTPQTTYLSPTTHLSTQPPTPQTTYLSPTSRLSTLPPTPITTQDTQRPVELVSQRDNWQDSQLGLVSRRRQQQDSQLGLVSRQQQQDSRQRSVEDSQQDNWLDYQMQNEIKRKTYEICKQWLGITWIVFFVIAKASEIGIKILQIPTSAKCLRSIFCGLEVIHIYMVYKILRKGHEFPIKRRVQIFVMLVICGGFTAGIMFMIAVDSPFEKWGFIGPLVSGCVWFIPVLPLISDRVPVLPL